MDFDALRQELSDCIVEGPKERYQFTWPDKSKAKLLANSPTTKTLRPCREESVDFDNTKNLYIEGDNLEVLKVLRETYLGKVKMIYIDPPYNTGSDFVYNDDFSMSSAEYKEVSEQYDEEGNRLVKNVESNGRFHTDWLNMMYSRLKISSDLLSNDGIICVSIDDNEQTNLRKVMDEIFGQSNFISQFIWKKKQGGGNDSDDVVIEHEYIICYSKNKSYLELGLDLLHKPDDSLYPYSDEKGDYGLITLDKASIRFSESLVFEITGPNGKKYVPRIVNGKQSCWRWSKSKVERQYDELVFKNGKVYTKYYRPNGVTPRSLLVEGCYGRTESGKDDINELFDKNPFSYPKPVSLIKHLISLCYEDSSVILDFFSGSATTAQAVISHNVHLNSNCKFIMVQLPETIENDQFSTICEVGKERIRRAGKKIKEESGKEDLDIGFRVFKLDESNMKDVFYKPHDTRSSSLEDFVSNVKPDRTPEDLLFQAILQRPPLDLSSKVEVMDINGSKVFIVEDGYLVACFDESLKEDVILSIAKLDVKPTYAVFRDSSMTDDAMLSNIEQIFKTYSPVTTVSII